MNRQNGNITWVEVLGQDTAALQAFYSKLVGWTFDNSLPMDYGMVDAAQSGIPGGVGKAEKGPGWTTFYVQVNDLDQALVQAQEMGGKILMPIMDLPQARVAVIADPEGHPFGLSQPKA